MATFVERAATWAQGLSTGARVGVVLDENVNTVIPRGFITLHAEGREPLKGDYVRGGSSYEEVLDALLPWATSEDYDSMDDEDDPMMDDGDGEFRTRRFSVTVK